MASRFFQDIGSRLAGNKSPTGTGRGEGNENITPGGSAAPSIAGDYTPRTSAAGGTQFGSVKSPTERSASSLSQAKSATSPRPNMEQPKFFFQEKYAKLGVKGNFMPLAAQPINVELGDWLAHQAFEQFGSIENLVACISERDDNTGMPLCNPRNCLTMSAGRHTYTWLNSNREPVKVPAYQYIGLVRRWIQTKLSDPKVFPTQPLKDSAATYASGNLVDGQAPIPAGPTTSNVPLSQLSGRNWVGKNAGFPENFFTDVKTIFRQIFRIYAHIYHSHWVNPFWHITGTNPPSSGWTDLNSCFVHFITVAKLFGLLSDKDLEPMQPLIDIWIQNGSIPIDAANGACAIVPQ